jgi:hypothetical protein
MAVSRVLQCVKVFRQAAILRMRAFLRLVCLKPNEASTTTLTRLARLWRFCPFGIKVVHDQFGSEAMIHKDRRT